MRLYPPSRAWIALIFRATFVQTKCSISVFSFLSFASTILWCTYDVIFPPSTKSPPHILKASPSKKEEIHPAIDKLLPSTSRCLMQTLSVCVFQRRSTAFSSVTYLTDATAYVLFVLCGCVCFLLRLCFMLRAKHFHSRFWHFLGGFFFFFGFYWLSCWPMKCTDIEGNLML